MNKTEKSCLFKNRKGMTEFLECREMVYQFWKLKKFEHDHEDFSNVLV